MAIYFINIPSVAMIFFELILEINLALSFSFFGVARLVWDQWIWTFIVSNVLSC